MLLVFAWFVIGGCMVNLIAAPFLVRWISCEWSTYNIIFLAVAINLVNKKRCFFFFEGYDKRCPYQKHNWKLTKHSIGLWALYPSHSLNYNIKATNVETLSPGIRHTIGWPAHMTEHHLNNKHERTCTCQYATNHVNDVIVLIFFFPATAIKLLNHMIWEVPPVFVFTLLPDLSILAVFWTTQLSAVIWSNTGNLSSFVTNGAVNYSTDMVFIL